MSKIYIVLNWTTWVYGLLHNTTPISKELHIPLYWFNVTIYGHHIYVNTCSQKNCFQYPAFGEQYHLPDISNPFMILNVTYSECILPWIEHFAVNVTALVSCTVREYMTKWLQQQIKVKCLSFWFHKLKTKSCIMLRNILCIYEQKSKHLSFSSVSLCLLEKNMFINQHTWNYTLY